MDPEPPTVGRERDLRAAARELADAERERTAWGTAWAGATLPLALPHDVAVGPAAELAMAWEQARGDLRALAQSRAIVARVERDASALRARASSLAGRLGLSVPDDAVAAAETIVRLWAANDAARVRGDALRPEVRRAEAEAAVSNDIRNPSGGATRNPSTPCYSDAPA